MAAPFHDEIQCKEYIVCCLKTCGPAGVLFVCAQSALMGRSAWTSTAKRWGYLPWKNPMRYERQELKISPLVEAVFELRTDVVVPYSLVPGEIHAQLKQIFPKYQELSRGFSTVPDIPMPFPFHRFLASDEKRFIQSGPGLLSVNVLGDYGGFSGFLVLITQALKAYMDVAQPKTITRLGLRYVNLVTEEVSHGVEAPTRVIVNFPAENLQGRCLTAGARGLFFYPQEDSTLEIITAEPHRIADGREGILLDLDFFSEKPITDLEPACISWLHTAHDIIYQTFRACLSTEMHTRMLNGEW
jgi:uncharacterized protein (TIGR04255 family)